MQRRFRLDDEASQERHCEECSTVAAMSSRVDEDVAGTLVAVSHPRGVASESSGCASIDHKLPSRVSSPTRFTSSQLSCTSRPQHAPCDRTSTKEEPTPTTATTSPSPLPSVRSLPSYSLALIFHWPSAITIACCSWWQARLADWLLFDLLLRFSRILALVFHEAAHVLVAAAFVIGAPPLAGDMDARANWFRSAKSFWQGLSFHLNGEAAGKRSFAWQLLPGGPMWAASVEIGQALPLCNKRSDEVVRVAGLVASLMLMLALLPDADSESVELALFLGSATVAAGALLSDLPWGPLFGALPPLGVYCCGNWGILVPRAYLGSKSEPGKWTSEGFPDACVRLLSNVLDIVELRGAQAGGCNTFLEAGDNIVSVRSRVVKTKRGHLASMLFAKLKKELRWKSWRFLASCQRLRPLPIIVAQGHSRFGTSSRPAVIETHPHQWMGAHKDFLWMRDLSTGKWVRKPWEKSVITTTITHNGDFDGWALYGKSVSNGQLGELLSRLLHCRNPAAGDSPKLAGMMDLLLCKGMWIASVRLAFVEVVMKHVEEASGWQPLTQDAPNEVPTEEVFANWAAVFDSTFAAAVKKDAFFSPSSAGVHELAGSVQRRIELLVGEEATSASFGGEDAAKLGRQAAAELQKWSMREEALGSFCKAACKNFFENDLLSSVCKFFAHAEGTFGVTVTSSIYPSSIVLAAKGQPMSIAMDAERPVAFWASEPASLNCCWPTPKGSRSAPRAALMRYDMHDATGEAVELRMVEGNLAVDHCDRLAGRELPGTAYEAVQYFPMPGTPQEVDDFHILMRGTTLRQQPTALSAERFNSQCVNLLSLPAPVPKRLVNEKGMDPVAYDIQDIPTVLADIEASWFDPSSLNWQSGDRFADCIRYLLKIRQKYSDSNVDILVYGIENSLWLGQQFIADFKRVFPTLNVLALSSNWVLGMRQEHHGHVEPLNFAVDPRTVKFSKHAVCLAISQSGTTYPTVWATRVLSRHPTPLHLFAMSGDFDTVLAASLGQDLTRANFACALFSNMSGIRPCEPSTVATVAMHHTLSHLLILTAEQVAKDVTVSSVFKPTELRELQNLLSTFKTTAEAMCGVSQHGYKLKSEVRQQLLATGSYLASHLLEGWYSILLGAIYVYLSVTFGFPVVTGTWTNLEAAVQEDAEGEWPRLYPHFVKALSYVMAHVDAHIYVFLAAILASIHRWYHGRRLWTRFCNRTIVICDSTVNYKLLRSYLTKLRALAFRFTTFGVAGQNPLDHFVHEMTHMTTSEVIVCMGRPDGRLGTLAAQEAAIIMSAQQSRFVASTPFIGIEAFSVGHNPWQKEGLFSKAITIPTERRPVFLSSKLMQTHKNGHAPGEVVAMCAALAEGRTEDQAMTVCNPTIDMPDLIKRMGGKESTMSEQSVKGLVNKLLKEQEDSLGIEAAKFRVEELLPRAQGQGNNEPNMRRSSIIKPLFTWTKKKKLDCEKCGKQNLPLDAKFCLNCGAPIEVREGSPNSDASTECPPDTAESNKGRSSFASVMPSPSEKKRKWAWSAGGANGYTPANVMALLRGHQMQKQVRALQAQKRQSELRKKIAAQAGQAAHLSGLKLCFEVWREKAQVTTKARRLTRGGSKSKLTMHPPRSSGGHMEEVHRAPWRVKEECRRKMRQGLFGRGAGGLVSIPKGMVFVRWAQLVRERKDALLGGGTAEEDCAIGSALAKGCANNAELVKGLRLLESLYETRVAAAERLLSWLIIYHRAVRPLSTLPFLSFDMDRSESRLRIASTPAPVPFCEVLPPQPAFHRAVTTIQDKFRERRNAQISGAVKTVTVSVAPAVPAKQSTLSPCPSPAASATQVKRMSNTSGFSDFSGRSCGEAMTRIEAEFGLTSPHNRAA
eukprot:TRINITY_DN8334_c0_g1_i2.p1 TRINITY_DN8334_c0_g1~~TRINITY_DN8334_c0_g1_i2.p1  ORF type:complete len:1861 (+),score=397.04 TRINITY_DN8334_c0_g1_i2:77-5659(+)